jgi:hypothetical protein
LQIHRIEIEIAGAFEPGIDGNGIMRPSTCTPWPA